MLSLNTILFYLRFGGIGGQGGNVVMIADENLSLNDVVKQHKTKRLVAVNGKNSSHNFILGPTGADATMQVPVGVSVYTDEGKNLGKIVFYVMNYCLVMLL